MPSGLSVGVAAGDEPLATAGHHADRIGRPAPRDRQEAEQHKMNERQEQPLQKRSCLLPGKAAHEIGS